MLNKIPNGRAGEDYCSVLHPEYELEAILRPGEMW